MDKVYKSIGASSHSINERETNDFYVTDVRSIKHLFDRFPILYDCDKITEPCAGDGIMADEIEHITNKTVDKYDLISRRSNILETDYFNLNIKNKSSKQGAIAYAWYIWRKNNDGSFSNNPPTLEWIDKL